MSEEAPAFRHGEDVNIGQHMYSWHPTLIQDRTQLIGNDGVATVSGDSGSGVLHNGKLIAVSIAYRVGVVLKNHRSWYQDTLKTYGTVAPDAPEIPSPVPSSGSLGG